MAQRRTNIHGREGIAGWVFTAPAMIILGVFLFVPIAMALWVSMTNWTGNVDPFGGGPNATFVGAKNYTALFRQDGLARSKYMQSLGNTFY
jgi:multiple sugar transport system permease protein